MRHAVLIAVVVVVAEIVVIAFARDIVFVVEIATPIVVVVVVVVVGHAMIVKWDEGRSKSFCGRMRRTALLVRGVAHCCPMGQRTFP